MTPRVDEARALRAVLLGPPGAGKGTQAARIAEAYAVPHIATGDIFRDNVKHGTALGREAKEYMDAGDLVPDDVVVGMVRDRLHEDDTADGFVLDGFPRTVPQAQALEEELIELGGGLHVVLRFAVSEEEVVRRITGRRVCGECSTTYHVDHGTPQGTRTCDRCGGQLRQRGDDSEDTVRHRLEVYHRQTEPLEFFYWERGLLRDIDAEGPVDAVSRRAFEVLREYAKPVQRA